MNRDEENRSRLAALGAKLAAMREARDISLNELASRTGISRQGIKLIENGERQPGIISLLEICRGLGTPLWKLIKELERSPENH